jgi:hypothetical protein
MKAYDKVRMVNTLGTVHKKTTTTNNAPASKYPLATYYPPAFLPAYLSLCKDEHGRRAVSSYFYRIFCFNLYP